jgi:hypothetical protein
MSGFKTIQPQALRDNPFKLIGADWMLITAGTQTAFNTMTASWGGKRISEASLTTCCRCDTFCT